MAWPATAKALNELLAYAFLTTLMAALSPPLAITRLPCPPWALHISAAVPNPRIVRLGNRRSLLGTICLFQHACLAA